MQPAGIDSRMRSRVGRNAVSRIDFDQPDFAVASVALQLQFTKSLVADALKKVIADGLRFGLGGGFDHGGRAKVNRFGSQLANDATAKLLTGSAETDHVAEFRRVRPLNDLLHD